MSKSSRKKQTPAPKPVTVPKSSYGSPIDSKASIETSQNRQPEIVRSIPDSKGGQEPELIRFDKRVKITLSVLVGIFLFMVAAKMYWGSIPIWNRLLPDGAPETRGLVAGTPRQIRMDDYAVGAPWLISNGLNGYPTENEAIGGLKSALLNVAAKHPIIFFKPGFWGYMIFDLEHGYAWMYSMGPFVLLCCSFLFFLLITKNQYFLSLTGAFTLLFSSGTASWTFIPAFMTGLSCAAFVSTAYLLHARKLKTILLSSFFLIYVVAAYILALYPPYQIPLAYLFLFVLAGYVVNERHVIFPLKSVPTKLLSLLSVTALAGIIFYLFREDIHETVTAVTSTVYPGKRSETGGTGFIANWYSEYYRWFFTDTKFPKSWLNSCEMAHYLNFVPLIIPLSISLFVQSKRIDWMIVGASVFVLIMLVWMEVGFPKGLATTTLMSMSPTRRTQIPMGIGSIVLLFIYLGLLKDKVKQSTPLTLAFIAGAIGFVIYTAYVNINDSDGLILAYQTFIPVLFFIAMNVLLIFSVNIPYRTAIFCIGILIFLIPNYRLNPISQGLSPITENAFYKSVRQLVEQDPEARWIVNGNQFVTYMVTATGAKQITGVKFIPDRKRIFSVLDPQMKRDSAYNRYAHVVFSTYIPGTGRDTVVLANQYEDGYVIAMDPCSPKLKQLNVKYMVFDHATQPVETRCMKEVSTLGSLRIFKLND
jgi:hypothetical protein